MVGFLVNSVKTLRAQYKVLGLQELYYLLIPHIAKLHSIPKNCTELKEVFKSVSEKKEIFTTCSITRAETIGENIVNTNRINPRYFRVLPQSQLQYSQPSSSSSSSSLLSANEMCLGIVAAHYFSIYDYLIMFDLNLICAIAIGVPSLFNCN